MRRTKEWEETKQSILSAKELVGCHQLREHLLEHPRQSVPPSGYTCQVDVVCAPGMGEHPCCAPFQRCVGEWTCVAATLEISLWETLTI